MAHVLVVTLLVFAPVPLWLSSRASRRTRGAWSTALDHSNIICLLCRMDEHLFYGLKESPGLAPILSTQIASELGRRVVSGAYPTGALVEDEGTLAEHFQVSRSVIRDAVKILVGKGLLEVRRGIGTRVRERANWGLLDDDVLAWHQSVPPSRDFLRQLLDIRLLVEPKAARWAAERGTARGLADIEEAQLRMEQEKGSIEDFVVADALFHRSILRAANNELLRSLEGAIFSALLGSIRLTNSDPRMNEDSIPFHRGVTDAILARDAARAEARMENLLSDTAHRLAEHLLET